MNLQKYKRLLIVLFFPLILAGCVLYLVAPFNKNPIVLCEIVLQEHCSIMTWDAADYKRKNYVAKFIDVDGDEFRRPPIRPLVEASPRTIRDARIIKITNKSGLTDQESSEISQLIGKSGGILLGTEDGKHSLYDKDDFIFYCHNINFSSDGIYSSRCFGKKWAVLIDYSLDEEGAAIVENLRHEINRVIDGYKKEYYVYLLLVIPFFLYLFLVLSFIIWLAAKAYRYVQKG